MASITSSSSWNPNYDKVLYNSIDKSKALGITNPQEIWQNAVDTLSQTFGPSSLFTQTQVRQRHTQIEQEAGATLIQNSVATTRTDIQRQPLAITSQRVQDAYINHITAYPEELTHLPRPEDIIAYIHTPQSSLPSNPPNKPTHTQKKRPHSASTSSVIDSSNSTTSISIAPAIPALISPTPQPLHTAPTDIVEQPKPKSQRTKEGEVREDDFLPTASMLSSFPPLVFLHLFQTHWTPFTPPPIATNSSNSTASNAISIVPAIPALISSTPQPLHTAPTDIAEKPTPQGTEEDHTLDELPLDPFTEEDEVRRDDVPPTTIRSWDLQSDLELLNSIIYIHPNANIIETPPEIWQKAIDQLSTRFGPSPLFTQTQIQQRFAQIKQAQRTCELLTPYEKYAIWFAYTQAPSGEKARAAKEALSTTRQKEVCSALIHRSVNMTQRAITDARNLNFLKTKIQNAYANHITAYPEEKAHLPTPENIIECINNVRKQKDSITHTPSHPASSFAAIPLAPKPPYAVFLAPKITEQPHPQRTEEGHALNDLPLELFTEKDEVHDGY